VHCSLAVAKDVSVNLLSMLSDGLEDAPKDVSVNPLSMLSDGLEDAPKYALRDLKINKKSGKETLYPFQTPPQHGVGHPFPTSHPIHS